MANEQPTLAEQLKSVSRMAMNLNMSIVSMSDVIEDQARLIEDQAKEIDRLKGLVPEAAKKLADEIR